MNFSLTSIRGLFRARDEIFRDASEGRQFDAVYLAMLVFACLIALFGLLLNSPAIIIGAMLISPLMGPILSCGLALTTADWELGKKAGRNVLLSVAEVVLIAMLATSVSPLRDVTPEILARTNPNLMDLLVAFFSGIAGTLALSSRKGGLMILPGVAIATAVMPPLATIGFGLSTGQLVLARGALMLFFTNFMAIVISAELVFLLVGFRPSRQKMPERARLLTRYRTVIAFAVLFAMSIPLLETLVHAAQQVKLRQSLSVTLRDEVKRSGRRLDSMNLQVGTEGVIVEATVQTPQYIDSTEIKSWEQRLSASAGRAVRLELQQLQLASKRAPHPENQDFLAGGSIRKRTPEPQLSPTAEIEKLQSKIGESLGALLAPAGIEAIRLRSLGKQPDGALLLDVSGVEVAPVDDAVWKVAAVGVAKETGVSVRISGSIAIADAISVIKYRQSATRPSRKELEQAERLIARWRNKPAMRYALLVHSSGDGAATERLAFLRDKFRDIAFKTLEAQPASDQDEQFSIRFQIAQEIDANSGTVADAAPLVSPQPTVSH